MPANPNPWDYADKSGKEHAHQAAVFMWANMAVNFGLIVANYKEAYTVPGWAKEREASYNDKVPELKWLFAIHNQGHGDLVRGSIAKAEGVKAGVFDLFLPVPIRRAGGLNGALPSQHLAGLFLEMKVDKNQPSNLQLEFQSFARSMHYAAEIAWGWLEARDKLLDYLGLPRYNAAIYKGS